MKLGKLPAAPRKTDLKFAHYRLALALPVIPTSFGFDHAVAPDSWGVLGNDQWGDCVWAGACHEHMTLTAIQSRERPSPTQAHFTDQNALAAYSAVTGFRPSDPNTDRGTNVHDAMSYRRHTGIKDAQGKVHQIGAYLSLTPGNMQEVFEALYLFQCVGIGFEFPASAMDQFDSGLPWSVVAGSPIEGGHYVPVLSKQGSNTVKIVTWGALQVMTDEFYRQYCDEAWCYVAPDQLKSTGVDVRGFNMAALEADLAAL